MVWRLTVANNFLLWLPVHWNGEVGSQRQHLLLTMPWTLRYCPIFSSTGTGALRPHPPSPRRWSWVGCSGRARRCHSPCPGRCACSPRMGSLWGRGCSCWATRSHTAGHCTPGGPSAHPCNIRRPVTAMQGWKNMGWKNVLSFMFLFVESEFYVFFCCCWIESHVSLG